MATASREVKILTKEKAEQSNKQATSRQTTKQTLKKTNAQNKTNRIKLKMMVWFKNNNYDVCRFTRGLDKALQAEEEQEEEECPESLQVVTNIIDKTFNRYNILNI